MKTIDAGAGIYLNENFYLIQTMSQGMLGYAEPSASPFFLSTEIDDDTLGATLRMALSASKKVSVPEFQEMFKSGVIQKVAKEREVETMKRYGYKTKRAMYKNMNKCSVDVVDEQIKIQPTHRKSLDSYTATQSGPEPLYLSTSSSDQELGAALREGFKRCTSAV
jgi:hypothetical protein